MDLKIQASYLGLLCLTKAWAFSLAIIIITFIVLTELLIKEYAIFFSWLAIILLAVIAVILMIKSDTASSLDFWDYNLSFFSIAAAIYALIGMISISSWYIPIFIICCLAAIILQFLYLYNMENIQIKTRYLFLQILNLIIISLIAWLRL